MRKVFRFIKEWFDTTKYKFVIFANFLKHGAYIRKELKINPQPKLSSEQKQEIREYFKSYGFNAIRPLWHRFYGGFEKRYSKLYIPQDLFFSHIEIALNRYEYNSLQDKNMLETTFTNVHHPKTIVKNINGFYQKGNQVITKKEAVESIANCDSVIIKPTINTYGGENVLKKDFGHETLEKKICSAESLLDSYGKDFVVQEFLDQSDEMKKLNPTSLNTIRICTYLNNEGVHILFSVVRFGGKGVCIDNVSQGGFYAAINDNGTSDKFAYDTWRKVIIKTPGGAELESFIIPNYEGVKVKVKELHQQVPFFKLISWDIAIDNEENPVLIEFNSFGQSIDFQAVTGPLFGSFTDEVLEITRAHRISRAS